MMLRTCITCCYYQSTAAVCQPTMAVSIISILSTCSCLCQLSLLSVYMNCLLAAVFVIYLQNLLQLSLSIYCSCLCQSAAVVFVNLLQLSLSNYCSCLYQCTAVVFISVLQLSLLSVYCLLTAALVHLLTKSAVPVFVNLLQLFCSLLQLSLSAVFVDHCSCLCQSTAAAL